MPDIVVHRSIAEKAFERLRPEIRGLIQPEIFRFAVMAPDLFFAYRFFVPRFRHGINQRAERIHHEQMAAFPVALAERGERPEAFSFLCGWLCHYAADSTLHPLVNALRGDCRYMHGAIEHKLEALELARQGKQHRDVMALFPDFPDIPEARQAMKQVFGWDDDYDRISYRHMKLQYWLYKDQHGLLNLLLGRTGGRLASLSYRNRLADGLDLSPFIELESEAVERGVELMTAAFRYRAGEIDADALRAVIGNRNYSGVEAE